MAERRSLIDLLGSADNYGEPLPEINRPRAVLGVVISLMIASWLCASTRIYIRFFVVRNPGWDDFFITCYLFTTTLGSIMICWLTAYGLGEHFLSLSIPTMEGYLLRFYIALGSYCGSTTFIKLSLLFQYLRVFSEPLMRRICYTMIVLVSIWGLTFSILAWIPCNVPAAAWTISLLTTSTCWGFDSFDPVGFAATFTTHAALNMTFDIIVFCIPIPLYFRKDSTFRTRMGLLALLFMGGIVVFVSIWRVASIVEHRAATAPTFDPTWYSPVSVVLSAVEVDAASICASAPVFWPVLRAQVMKVFVTQEIEIIHENRSDEFEMNRSWSNQSAQEATPSTHSHHGSEVGLQFTISEDVEKAKDPKKHYDDRYIQKQVNPFAKDSGVASTVQAGRSAGKSWKN